MDIMNVRFNHVWEHLRNSSLQSTLIAGTDNLLESHLAAFSLMSSPDTTVTVVLDGPAMEQNFSRSVIRVLRRIAQNEDVESLEQQTRSRLRIITLMPTQKGFDISDIGQFSQRWYCSGGRYATQLRGMQFRTGGFKRFSTLFSQSGISELNFVITAPVEDEDATFHGDDGVPSESEIVEYCNAWNINYRIFYTSLVIGECQPADETQDFLQFFSVLHGFKQQIHERVDDYFHFQALRLLIFGEASLNLIRADDAAALMMIISSQKDTIGQQFSVRNGQTMSFEDLCEQIGRAYRISLIAVEGQAALNAVDRLFQSRIGAFKAYLTSPQASIGKNAFQVAGYPEDSSFLSEAELINLFKAIRSLQDEALTARNERLKSLSAQIEQKTIEGNGPGLTYFIAGSGVPVVVLNALGQGLSCWFRLIDVLRSSYRIIIWEPRGTIDASTPIGISDQVDDLEAVLRNEQISTCHVIGWCTGPKVATEFCLRHPNTVLSMVFLNAQFKYAATSKELLTSYENRLEPLFRLLDSNPSLAGSIMKTLQTSMEQEKPDLSAENDSEALSANVLAQISRHLQSTVMMPFQSEETTVRYARQVLNFWKYDTITRASEVDVPVLLIAAENDKIAAPAMSRAAVQCFPRASHMEVQGANHYLLYEHPDFVAAVIEDFFRAPGNSRGA